MLGKAIAGSFLKEKKGYPVQQAALAQASGSIPPQGRHQSNKEIKK